MEQPRQPLLEGQAHDLGLGFPGGDASFSATGYYDTDGDGGIDTSQGWNAVDCKTLIVP